MATLTVKINCAMNAETMQRNYQRPVSAKYPTVQAIADLLQGILSGNQLRPSVTVGIPQDATKASGTLTFASVVATNTFAINGVTFTCVASAATGNQFNVGADDTESAANAVAAILASASALVSDYVTATSALGVITVQSIEPGIGGNDITLTGGTHITASGARLTGGAEDANEVTYTF